MPRNTLNAGGEEALHCACGRSFLLPGALSKHRGTCTTSKKRLSGALDKAKKLWTGRKRRHLETDAPTALDPSPVGATLSSTQGLLPIEALQDVSD
jgi:hypothetical protein